jgi:hypothetical protein
LFQGHYHTLSSCHRGNRRCRALHLELQAKQMLQYLFLRSYITSIIHSC